ncbi:hypothetical protein JCM10908_006778 [Rhodotorula pacifica]|uniref:uncharacterized protein n=1 Tax=Rhodotorula pacifica TaxID=1495444 RepID=UPI003172BF5A
MRSPFRCFGSSGYEATLPRNATPPRQPRYSTDALPPLQASHPSRRNRALRKESIGSPTEFEHVGHNVLPTPVHDQARRDGIHDEGQTDREGPQILEARQSTDMGQLATPQTGNKRASLPSPVASPSSSQDPPKNSAQRQSAENPAKVKRKAPPAVTASVIRSAGGKEAVARTGPIPSRLLAPETAKLTRHAINTDKSGSAGETGSTKVLLKDLFSPSELNALSAASDGQSASILKERFGDDMAKEGDYDGTPYETDTTKAFQGALRSIEEALKREVSEGSFGASR